MEGNKREAVNTWLVNLFPSIISDAPALVAFWICSVVRSSAMQ
ncbi:hypothetical protein bcere0009_46410 [Bacillus cereus R309803]|nr:hypothetical protein bcere0009_46410 [Bacillus cereus R309803]